MRFLATGLAKVVAGMPVTAAAQRYPEKSIRFIVPYAPGGGNVGAEIAAMPDSPTMIEAGLPGFEATSWYCVVAPAGTPKAIIDRLNSEIVKALNTPEMPQRLADEGAAVEPSTPGELARFVHAEIPKWGQGRQGFGGAH